MIIQRVIMRIKELEGHVIVELLFVRLTSRSGLALGTNEKACFEPLKSRKY